MTARNEVLAAAKRLAAASPDGAFHIDDVVRTLREQGSAYAESTIRTHVASRMCANAPGNHAKTYDDLVSIGGGRYRLASG